jgi:hypothetical protein
LSQSFLLKRGKQSFHILGDGPSIAYSHLVSNILPYMNFVISTLNCGYVQKNIPFTGILSDEPIPFV